MFITPSPREAAREHALDKLVEVYFDGRARRDVFSDGEPPVTQPMRTPGEL